MLHCKECGDGVSACLVCDEGYELLGRECKVTSKAEGKYPSFEAFKDKFGKVYASEKDEMRARQKYLHNVDRLQIYEGEKF